MASEGHQQAVALTASQADTVQSVLQQWSKTNLVDPNLVSDLLATIRVDDENHGFDWQTISKYTSRLAVFYFATTVLTFFLGGFYQNIVGWILDLPLALRLLATLGSAAMVHTWGYRRSLAKPQNRDLNEVIHLLGAFATALAAIQLGNCKRLSGNAVRRRWDQVLPVLAFIYGILAVWFKSSFIWSCGMAALGFSTFVNKNHVSYVLGNYSSWFNFPILLLVLGLAMICLSHRTVFFHHTADFRYTTWVWGLGYIFNAMWALSEDDWYSNENRPMKERTPLLWTTVLFVSASLALWHGLRFNNSTTTGFGVAYLFLIPVSTSLLIASSCMSLKLFNYSGLDFTRHDSPKH
ncbi:hypothetical protein Hte_003182 [Hypoxylon texense]